MGVILVNNTIKIKEVYLIRMVLQNKNHFYNMRSEMKFVQSEKVQVFSHSIMYWLLWKFT